MCSVSVPKTLTSQNFAGEGLCVYREIERDKERQIDYLRERMRDMIKRVRFFQTFFFASFFFSSDCKFRFLFFSLALN
jgi:hypothetical protein